MLSSAVLLFFTGFKMYIRIAKVNACSAIKIVSHGCVSSTVSVKPFFFWIWICYPCHNHLLN